jgi:hypothetical protein
LGDGGEVLEGGEVSVEAVKCLVPRPKSSSRVSTGDVLDAGDVFGGDWGIWMVMVRVRIVVAWEISDEEEILAVRRFLMLILRGIGMGGLVVGGWSDGNVGFWGCDSTTSGGGYAGLESLHCM